MISILCASVTAIFAALYDLVCFLFLSQTHAFSVFRTETWVAEWSSIAAVSFLICVVWQLSEKCERARFWLQVAPVWLGLALVYHLEFRVHTYTTAFFLVISGLLLALPFLKLRRFQLPLHGLGLLTLVLLNSWDQIFFRFAGLHIAGFHWCLSFLIICELTWFVRLALKKRLPQTHSLRVVSLVLSVVCCAGLCLVNVSPLTRAAVLLNLNCGQVAGLLFSKSVLGRSNPSVLPLHDSPLNIESYIQKVPVNSASAQVQNAWIIIVDTLKAEELCKSSVIPERYRSRFSCVENVTSVSSGTAFAIPSLLLGRHSFEAYAEATDWFQAFPQKKRALPGKPFPTAQEINSAIAEEFQGVRKNERNLFYTHYLDVHLPGWFPPSFFAVGHEWYQAQYQASLEKMQQGLLELFQWFDSENIWENTAVVVTSDHGEDMYEKGYYSHAYTLSQNVLKVPVFIAIPGKSAEQVKGPRLSLDIAPTLSNLLGISRSDFEGRSLFEPTDPARCFFSTSVLSKKVAVTRGSRKLVFDFERQTLELYDLSDRAELENLVEAEPEVAEEMATAIAAFAQAYRFTAQTR